MIVLGLLLILIAIGACAVAARATMVTSPVIELTAINTTIMASPLAMFISGAASVALLGLGFALLQQGTRRKRRSRNEIRQLRKDNAAVVAQTSSETEGNSSRDRLHAESTTDTTKAGPKDKAEPKGPSNNGNKESNAQEQLERHPRSESSS
jgi:hypothetical protein